MPSLRRVTLTMIAAAALLAGGCSTKNDDSPFSPGTGHGDGYRTAHPAGYWAEPDTCRECHGADLQGGIAKVSCFLADRDSGSCHAGGPGSGGHPAGFGASAAHGAAAMAAPGPGTGFSTCQNCHGADFGGGSAGLNCFTCHGVQAPHARRPWSGHVGTAEANIAVCATCHPARATPGCFNNSVCHGPREIHPAGWGAPSRHGPPAKAAPGGSTGFDYCAECHGSKFTGGSAGVACQKCHGVAAPHPPKPWRGGTYTHTNTNRDNAPACAECHPASGAPDCFNNSLCHGPRGNPHPSGWGSPGRHGPVAKARPGAESGFSWCQACHGTYFRGAAAISCSSAICHSTNVPHPDSPWRGTRTHVSTNTGNAGVCALCHRDPGAPDALPSGCFNTSLCHGAQD